VTRKTEEGEENREINKKSTSIHPERNPRERNSISVKYQY